MKKYYIVRYDNDTLPKSRFETLPKARAMAEALARSRPGKTVCVFQIKDALKVDTVPVIDVTLEG